MRLYSVDAQGRHGVVFRSLETERLLVSLGTRSVLGVPYNWASMDLRRPADRLEYTSTRRPPFGGRATGVISVRVGEPTEPTELETWLTARWGLHTRTLGRTLFLPNEHPPWQFHSAELVEVSGNLVPAAGVELGSAAMLRPLWTPGVRTTFGPPQRVSG